ncbi:hypothetical protein AMECASPLE_020817 [Ameca splendens]|uniref:Uncharacterized protein n=1 Tax=Ameca splendens TaxID=208324 RepID=A0ABV0ZZ17_9TELE
MPLPLLEGLVDAFPPALTSDLASGFQIPGKLIVTSYGLAILALPMVCLFHSVFSCLSVLPCLLLPCSLLPQLFLPSLVSAVSHLLLIAPICFALPLSTVPHVFIQPGFHC